MLTGWNMSENNTMTLEPIDLNEVARRIDMASGLFAHAAQSFADMSAVFEAIRAAAAAGSLTARLAQLGVNNCETHDSEFTEWQEDFSAHAEIYSAALPNHPFLRSEEMKRGLCTPSQD